VRRRGGSRGRFERTLRGSATTRAWRGGALRGRHPRRPAPGSIFRARFPCRCRVRHLPPPFGCGGSRKIGRGLAPRCRSCRRARQGRSRPPRLRCLAGRGFCGAGHTIGRRRFFLRLLRLRPPDDQHLAEMLDGGGAERIADAREHRVAFGALVARGADLDQLVRAEIDVDFMQHRGRQPVLADADHRMQVVRLRAKRAALGR